MNIEDKRKDLINTLRTLRKHGFKTISTLEEGQSILYFKAAKELMNAEEKLTEQDYIILSNNFFNKGVPLNGTLLDLEKFFTTEKCSFIRKLIPIANSLFLEIQ